MFYARIRQYDSSLGAALFEDNIPSAVYDNLIESVHNSPTGPTAIPCG
ncbi:MAG: hypothetical protein U5N58_14900 [Actinomycetota bacterium]|nr:hypothetical protein [Actinomycetota bacterium]